MAQRMMAGFGIGGYYHDITGRSWYGARSGSQPPEADMADPISTMKNISEIIKKYNDLELIKQIVSLQTEVFDLQRENLALKKHISDRTEREKMLRKEPHGYYYKDGQEVPHCP